MTAPARWTLSIDLRSPFLIPGPSVNATLSDATPARNGGRPIIPGSLIRGLFRDALETAGFDAAVKAFGDTSKADAAKPEDAPDTVESRSVNNIPNRRKLDIPDLKADDKTLKGSTSLFTRVALDSAGIGAPRDGHLQFIELAAPLGCVVRFTGVVTGPVDVLEAMSKARRLIRAVGSNKSAGFGEVVDIALSPETNPVPPSCCVGTFTHHIDIAFELDRPFVVDSERSTANQFKGAEVIPGAVLKGALAGWIDDLGVTSDQLARTRDQLARTRVGHAFPTPTGEKPVVVPPSSVPPLSLALCKKGKKIWVLDRLLSDDLENLPPDGWGPPFFAADWKREDRKKILKFLELFGPDLCRDTRTRTAINDKTGAAAYDHKTETGGLFSYSAVRPEGHRWVSRWLIPDDVDPATLSRLESRLRDGLPGVGKTRAVAKAVAVTAIDEPPPQPLPNGQWAVTLQTDAALGDGAFSDYQTYWASHGFTLIRHFADQRLVGGYQALRYPAKPDGYAPYVLTRAGSVFLLEGGDAGRMAAFLRHGLPPAPPFDQRDWQCFPFGRENGFGAVRLNALDHVKWRKGEELADEDGAHA